VTVFHHHFIAHSVSFIPLLSPAILSNSHTSTLFHPSFTHTHTLSLTHTHRHTHPQSLLLTHSLSLSLTHKLPSLFYTYTHSHSLLHTHTHIHMHKLHHSFTHTHTHTLTQCGTRELSLTNLKLSDFFFDKSQKGLSFVWKPLYHGKVNFIQNSKKHTL